MKYYLTPTAIAEALNLTQLRRSTPGGYYLLSEYDLAPYGIEKAIEEGAIELKDNIPPLPTAEQETESEQEPTEDGGDGEDVRNEEEQTEKEEEE